MRADPAARRLDELAARYALRADQREKLERLLWWLARALGPQAMVAEYAAPLLRRGGMLIDWRGKRSHEEEQRAMHACAELGIRVAEIRPVTPFPGAAHHHLHLYLKARDTPSRFPR